MDANCRTNPPTEPLSNRFRTRTVLSEGWILRHESIDLLANFIDLGREMNHGCCSMIQFDYDFIVHDHQTGTEIFEK
jgi:hypothetical protein